ncbi:protein of unknown function DUF262 [Rhodopseudomonas palustris BisB5]|uniref:DUF262 domain-containing protein n=1 Tax=Rhodopseudomonas palustris (strain BisB5) TaxID=316057 RepID=Q131S3_RHOPS|nr:protein of unknown function DUF262 [Rhodopseudomonas palustris BisB5]
MINADQHPVAEVLGDKFIHEIPPYQRPYAWTSDQALQLIEDLREAMSSGADEPYFLGSIVLIRPRGEPVGQVVDGQQRLTTLTILAAVLRDLATDPDAREAISGAVYIKPNPYKKQVESVRILPHSEDRIFFREAIQFPDATSKSSPPHQPKTEAQKLMWDNALALRKRVVEMTIEDRQRLVDYLLNNCVLVVVSTESRGAALRIFRVLNDRGLDLSNADVIKADLLGKFKDHTEMAHQAARWRDFETDLGRNDFEDLLENLRFIREKGKNRSSLSEAYELRFKMATPPDVRNFLDHELAPAKRWFAEIVDGDGADFPTILRSGLSEALAGLRLVPNKDWMPVALAAAMQFGATEKLLSTLVKLEGLAWIMQLGRRYDTQRMNRYGEIIGALGGPDAELESKLVPSVEENDDAWSALSGKLYSKFPVRVVRAVLERLDRLLSEQIVVWDGQKTVEHILPQNPEAGEWVGFDSERREAVTDTLGNLVLLTSRKNSSASNLPFAKKRLVYFGLAETSAGKKRATYASAQELGELRDWDVPAYRSRQERHLALLAKRWGITLQPTVQPPAADALRS